MHRSAGLPQLPRWPLRALAGALLCVTLGSAAQTSEQITLNMRNADINSVLQWLAETTGKRVIVDPRVKGQVTILSRDPMSPAEALQVVVAAINVYGFTAIEQGEVLQVVPAANIKTGTTQQLDSLKDPNVDFPVNEVVRLGVLPAEQVATTLRPLMPPNAGLMALPGGNALLVTDTASGVRRIARLARELDQNATIDLDVVPLAHASADELLAVVQKLLGAEEGKALQLVSDQRVNAIVMAGTPEMRARARDIITRLDQPELAEGNVQVVYLHYLKASEVLAVLKGMSARDEKGKDGAPRAPFAIEASESTNALVISAAPDQMDAMLEIIRKLDIRRAQVLVEAIIAEVSDGVARELGVEWKTSFDGEGVEGIQRFSNGLVQVADNPLAAVGRGLTLGYFRNGSLRALLRALEVDGKTNILSTPSIVTLDNQEAEILVGSNVPFKTGESSSEAAPTSNPFTTIERQDIGVTLKVTPQINQGDAITLDILQSVETLTESEEAEDIITDKRSIRTSVMLEDQDILVLGGLSQDEVTENVQKVPVLGDIPLLGKLFRSTTTTVDKRNLMVFVRTRILTDLATAEQETLDRYNRVRELQQQFNEPDGKGVLLDSSPVLPPLEGSGSP